ncbi:MAG TPA: hypothetical protein VJN42_10240 [Candidatus Acidoferrum sp.]|nr:hypothetical protein [Candidatus Acidoferrum sp.]
MRKRSLVMAALMACTTMASTRVAHAQESLVVNIPFDFSAGNSRLPAGEYAVKSSGPAHILLLMNRTDPAASIMVRSNAVAAGAPQTDSKLVFHRYGDRYFLSQVWTAGYSLGRQLLQTGPEKEAARMAKNQDQSDVVLAATLTK